MALSKRITIGNGVTVNYHRVVSVSVVTNVANIIEVASYTSEGKRVEEVEAIAQNKEMNVFIETMCIDAEYDPDMSIEAAYNYIKKLPEFEGATDNMLALSNSR